MTQRLDLRGGGGGGGGSSFKQTPDNLRSNDSFEVLLGLGEGRWKGLTNGHKSLKINDVPMESEDGTANFQDFVAVFADGDPAATQIVSFNLGAGAGSSTVNLALTNTNTSSPGPWVTAAVSNPGADFIDLRFVVQQLYHQTDKGIYNATANIEVELQASGSSTWVNPLAATPTITYDPDGYQAVINSGDAVKAYLLAKNFLAGAGSAWNPGAASQYLSIQGKTTSPYVKEMRIAVPNTGAWAGKTWTVRCRLREKDLYQAQPVEDRRTIVWESIAPVFARELGADPDWRGLVWLQLYGKASDQINGMPTISGVYDTKIVKVPPLTVFDPETRGYTGATWDGSDNFAYTNDPAWCLRDAVENPLSGISAFAPGTTLNKWDCLEASKYYSELVPDGKGGYHPRFSMNIGIDDPQDANELLNYLAGAVSSVVYEGGDGRYRLTVDKPQTPVAIFTKENIVGQFIYSHTDVDTRFNDYTGTFLNEENGYAQDSVRVFSQPHIDKYGRRPTQVVLVGCTNRQEALRRLMLRLRVSTREDKIVTFQTNRQARFLEPLNTILIADADLGAGSPSDSTGRILSMNGARTQLTLRDPIHLDVGVNYTIKFTVPNPDYDPLRTTQPTAADWRPPTVTITRNVTNTSGQRGNVTTIYLDAALPASIAANANFALDAVGLPTLPLTYRVVDAAPDESNPENWSVTATIVDTGKWYASDNVSETEINLQQPTVVVPPPVAAATPFTLKTFQGELGTRRTLQVDWERPGSLFLSGFTVEHSLNDGPWRSLIVESQEDLYEFVDPVAGTHSFRIYAVDRRGARSLPLQQSYVVPDMGVVAGRSLAVIADRQNITFDSAGALAPSTQNTLFTAQKQNTTVTPIWTVQDSTGTLLDSTALAGGTVYQNLMIQSQNFAGWDFASNVSVTPNTHVAPDGTTTADTLTDTSSSAAGFIVNGLRFPVSHTMVAGLSYFYNIRVLKTFGAQTYPKFYGTVDGGSGALGVSLNTDTGATTGGGTVVDYGTYWLLRWPVVSGTVSGPGQNMTIYPSHGYVSAFDAGDVTATGSCVCWGAQVTLGAHVPYIETGPSIRSGILAESVTMTAAAFNTARGSASGLTVTATVDDVGGLLRGKSALARVGDGAAGKTLTVISDRQSISFDSAGVASPSTQTTTFDAVKVNTTATINWSVKDNLGNNLTPTTSYLSAATGDTVTMTRAQFEAAIAVNGATGVVVTGTDGAGLTDKVSVVKVRNGADGAAGKTLTVISDRQSINFDSTGAPSPSAQTTTFDAVKVNTTATINWSIKDNLGNNLTPTTTYLSAATGDTITMTRAQFEAALAVNGATAVVITGTDGAGLTDKVSVVKVRSGADGAPGANGKTLTVIADRQSLTYDGTGVASPSTQTTTFEAVKVNTTATINWSIKDSLGNNLTPVTSYLSAATGDTVTMTRAQFEAAIAVNGATGVVVTGTDGAGLTDKVSVVKVRNGADGAPGGAGSATYTLGAVATVLGSATVEAQYHGVMTGATNVTLSLQQRLLGATTWSTFASDATSGSTGDDFTLNPSGFYSFGPGVAGEVRALLNFTSGGANPVLSENWMHVT